MWPPSDQANEIVDALAVGGGGVYLGQWYGALLGIST